MKTVVASSLLVLALVVGQAATAERLTELRAELEAMHETDQAQRLQMARVEREHGASSSQMAELWKQQSASDAHNIRRLEEIIAEIGWPKRSAVGDRAAGAAFLILQHSDLSYQKKYLQVARAAAAENELRPSSLALLEDRILLREGKKQIYGSQVRRNEAGEWEAHSLEDPERVDERRASVGLPPLAQYLAGFAERSGGTVANRTKDAPRADAPPLRQDLFSAADDARAAYEKLQKVRPASFAERRTLILACHDFCRRFPEHSLYGAVVVLAVRTTSFLPAEERRDLGDWDPAAAEQEAKLNAEQRAEVALTLATGRAAEQMRQGGGDWGERQFEALVAVVPPHRATQHARQALLRAALEAPPARAMAVLRELFPGDSTVAAGIQALEQIGRPCELAFTAFDGRPVKTADSRGKVVWVVFWLGAGGVDTTMSKVKELAERHGPADLAVVGVSFDRNREVVQETIDRHRLTWPVHFDGRGWSSELGSRFQIRVLPAYLLIDREGILRFRGGSPTTVGAIARIDQLLAEKPPAR